METYLIIVAIVILIATPIFVYLSTKKTKKSLCKALYRKPFEKWTENDKKDGILLVKIINPTIEIQQSSLKASIGREFDRFCRESL